MSGAGGLLRRTKGASRPRYADIDRRQRKVKQSEWHGFKTRRWVR